jgi:hypothetical protein
VTAFVLWAITAGAAAQTPPAEPPPETHQHGDHETGDQLPTTPPHQAMASGTSWLPDDTPMNALHRRAGAWDVMLHGNVVVQYLADQGARGHDQLGSINWLMLMADRGLAGGRASRPAAVRPCTTGSIRTICSWSSQRSTIALWARV